MFIVMPRMGFRHSLGVNLPLIMQEHPKKNCCIPVFRDIAKLRLSAALHEVPVSVFSPSTCHISCSQQRSTHSLLGKGEREGQGLGQSV